MDEVVPTETKLELAALVYSPAHVAQQFGRHCLQFYCREEFVALARRTYWFYRQYSARNGDRFRGVLDRILRERGEAPIDWSRAE